jgi:hypothetical protein
VIKKSRYGEKVMAESWYSENVIAETAIREDKAHIFVGTAISIVALCYDIRRIETFFAKIDIDRYYDTSKNKETEFKEDKIQPIHGPLTDRAKQANLSTPELIDIMIKPDAASGVDKLACFARSVSGPCIGWILSISREKV